MLRRRHGFDDSEIAEERSRSQQEADLLVGATEQSDKCCGRQAAPVAEHFARGAAAAASIDRANRRATTRKLISASITGDPQTVCEQD